MSLSLSVYCPSMLRFFNHVLTCVHAMEPPANSLHLLRSLLLFTFFSLRAVICQAGLLSCLGHQTLLDYDRRG